MPKPNISYPSAVAAGLFTLIAFFPNWAFAGDCLAQPNRQMAPSGHWFYRVDHVNYRKCWYLAGAHAEASAEAQPAPDATLRPPTLSSFFASLSAGTVSAKPAGTQQDVMKDDARPIKFRAHDEKKGDVSRLKPALVAKHRDANAAPSRELVQQSPTGAPVERAAPAERRDNVDATERDALFQEFLRWNARQNP
jgi:hypothetical protein